ncbi:MAG: energy transducer TonB [Pseudomonadota bacterium]
MGEAIPFRQEDGAGLVVAFALHAAVVAALLLQPITRELAPMPDRMTVSLASEVSLEATAPEIVTDSRAAVALTLDELPVPPVEEASPDTAPQETAPPAPTPPPPTTRRSASTQAPPPPDRDRSRPDRRPEEPQAAAEPTDAAGSRIGDDFLEGGGSATDTDETAAPAPTFGRRERAALSSSITRQLRPNWSAPIGVDAEKLVSIVSWKLNPDGSLKGNPTCRNVPSSVTNSNRPQAALHCERAIRAVRRAAPFNLPDQFYSRWDDLEWQFDRRL